MAIANLKKEMQLIVDMIERPGEYDKNTRFLRKFMDGEYGTYSTTRQELEQQLRLITQKTGRKIMVESPKKGKMVSTGRNERKSIFELDPDLEKGFDNFADLWWAAAQKVFKSKKTGTLMIEADITSKKLEVTAFQAKGSSASVFKYFQDGQKEILDLIKDEGDDLADKIIQAAKKPSGASAFFDVGHRSAVAETKLSTLVAAIADSSEIEAIFGTKEQGKKLITKTAQDSITKAGLEVTLDDNIEIRPTEDGFSGKHAVSYKPESWSENQIENNAQDQLAGKIIRKEEGGILSALEGLLEAQLEGLAKDSDEYIKRKGSHSIEDMAFGLLLNNPTMRNVYRKGLAKNLSKYTYKPKSRKNTTNATAKMKKPKRVLIKGGGLLKIPVTRSVRAKIEKQNQQTKVEGGTNDLMQKAFETRAFVNSRLAKTLAGNMGRPALENQTGRFARSAQVTNAMAVGNQVHMDYTYSPLYRVFEGGDQFPINYDPRPLIENSIRELAAAKLETKFTLRRV